MIFDELVLFNHSAVTCNCKPFWLCRPCLEPLLSLEYHFTHVMHMFSVCHLFVFCVAMILHACGVFWVVSRASFVAAAAFPSANRYRLAGDYATPTRTLGFFERALALDWLFGCFWSCIFVACLLFSMHLVWCVWACYGAVSYTHLTLPTNREV